MPGIEDSLNEPDANQDYCKRQVGDLGWLTEWLPGNENEDSTNEKDRAKSTEEVTEDLARQL